MQKARRSKSDGLLLCVLADALEHVVPLKYGVVVCFQFIGGNLFMRTARGYFVPVALFVGDDEIEYTAQVVVLAEKGIVEIICECHFFEYFLHGLAQENIKQGEHADQESRIRRQTRAIEVGGNEFTELCTQEREGEEFGRFVLGEGLKTDERYPASYAGGTQQKRRLLQVGHVVAEADPCRIDVGEQLVNKVCIR